MLRRPGLIVCLALLVTAPAAADTRVSVAVRGKSLTAYVSGPADGEPVLVLSGDGGWIHLGPDVAKRLASRGCHVVGIDSREYLSKFTSGQKALSEQEVPGDVEQMLAALGSGRRKPIVVGVSVGAGLAVLAATDPGVKQRISGIVALGLGDVNELGWRLRDALIYLTKGNPREPSFLASRHIGNVSPLPIAAIHSTHDEFVPVSEVRAVMGAAHDPKRLWIVNAGDHRFRTK